VRLWRGCSLRSQEVDQGVPAKDLNACSISSLRTGQFHEISCTRYAPGELDAPQYLLLLGIAQSCKFQGKGFLKFLLSLEKDVDAFRAAKRKKIAIAVGAAGRGWPVMTGPVSARVRILF
jgi:hypothetical protein